MSAQDHASSSMNESGTVMEIDAWLTQRRSGPVRDPYRYQLVDKFGMKRGGFPTARDAADAAERIWPDQLQDPDRTGAGYDVEAV